MATAFDSIVDPGIHALLRRERELLVELREALDSEQVEERRRIEELLAGLDDLFMIVIVGEFNAGKSSLINALFGAGARVEGPIPVDDKISILRYGEPHERRVSALLVEQHYPVEFLQSITLVDTPGTNSIVQRHQELTEDFIPRADLVLFVTSIDRPLAESERAFLQYIAEWGKKIVFVLNKVDTKSQAEVGQVLDYLRSNVRALFKFDPVIYPVAAKVALGVKQKALPLEDWARSGFDEFETYIFDTLSEGERIRLKLTAPLDTAASLLKKQRSLIDARRELLAADVAKIDRINEQLELARKDIKGNFSQFVTRIDNLMMELERRGVDFLDRMIRITHIMLLRDAARFREEFERQVFYDFETSVDRTIQESVDWLVKGNMRLWRDTVEQFERRTDVETLKGDVVGRVGRDFAYNRDEVYTRIRTEAERRMRTYDLGVESRELIDSAMQGLVQSFGLGAGALGLGYVVTSIFSSVAIDVTGLTAATMLLVSSFLVLPYKRSKAKTEFREKIDALRRQLNDSLSRESDVEIDRMIDHIAEAFQPYSRFYGAEMEKIDRFAAKLEKVDRALGEIGDEVRRKVGGSAVDG